MKIDVKCDMTAFRKGLQHKLALTKKSEAQVLNDASRNVCLRATGFTVKASAAKIRQTLSNPRLLSAATAKRLRAKGVDPTRLHPAQFRAEMKKTVNLRVRSVGYIGGAGWVKAAQAFGGGKNRKVSAKGRAAKGYGKKATDRTLAASGANLATGAVAVGRPGLQQALNFVGKDMLKYAPKQIARAWK